MSSPVSNTPPPMINPEWVTYMRDTMWRLTRILAKNTSGAEAMARTRYAMRINSERQQAKRFLETLVRDARADIRARGLDIPRG